MPSRFQITVFDNLLYLGYCFTCKAMFIHLVTEITNNIRQKIMLMLFMILQKPHVEERFFFFL